MANRNFLELGLELGELMVGSLGILNIILQVLKLYCNLVPHELNRNSVFNLYPNEHQERLHDCGELVSIS